MSAAISAARRKNPRVTAQNAIGLLQRLMVSPRHSIPGKTLARIDFIAIHIKPDATAANSSVPRSLPSTFFAAGASRGLRRRAKIASGDFFTPSIPGTRFAPLLPAMQKSLRRK